MSLRTGSFPATLAAILLTAAACLSAACGGAADRQAVPEKANGAASGSQAAPVTADDGAAATAPDAAGDAADLRAPGAGAPPPPSPLPALNDYAEQCLRIEPPEEASEAGVFVADCCAQLLETLRATVGALHLPAEDVGDSLTVAETAVRHLGAGAGASGEDAAGRAARATTALAALARAVATTDAADGGAPADGPALDALDAAADAVDAGRPLGEQGDGVAAFFARADAVVRPLARAGGL